MTMNFGKSKTKDNIMRAFAGESQARNRYTFAGEAAAKQGMYAIQDIFLYTAEQERAHAARYYELLKMLSGQTIFVDGGYPVDQQETLVELLQVAEGNERAEYEDVYQAFGDAAKAEGFLEAASTFYQIAEIEHIHQKRFGKLAEMLKHGTYFESEQESSWMCTNCGHIHKGRKAPGVCPVCRHEQGYFLPEIFIPYRG